MINFPTYCPVLCTRRSASHGHQHSQASSHAALPKTPSLQVCFHHLPPPFSGGPVPCLQTAGQASGDHPLEGGDQALLWPAVPPTLLQPAEPAQPGHPAGAGEPAQLCVRGPQAAHELITNSVFNWWNHSLQSPHAWTHVGSLLTISEKREWNGDCNLWSNAEPWPATIMSLRRRKTWNSPQVVVKCTRFTFFCLAPKVNLLI